MSVIRRVMMTMKTTQTSEVLKYLKEEGSITSLQAINLFGATRLSDIIFRLRKHHNIETQKILTKNRYGNVVKYGKYIYHGEKGELK